MELLLCELSVGELTALFCTIIFALIPLLIWALCHLESQRLSGWIMIRKKLRSPNFIKDFHAARTLS
jgi:hypothetical protein